ncbi:MAG TPA: deoxyribonuclease IV [Rubrobacteraceae bacterium]|nr:deoxyribonuclease IV [Rubrobacteraceae bacterium]
MSKRTNSIGRHLPTSGGLKKTLQKAKEQGCETVQIFVSNPQGWADPVPRPDREAFVEGTREMRLSPVVVHAKYLINLASSKEEQRERSVRTLARELVAAGALGADLVVVHSGSYGDSDEKRGMARLVESLLQVRELTDGDGAAEPVIENSVGAGTQLCSTFETLADAAERAGVRICVDTAHAFVAGYDLSTLKSTRRVAGELQEALDGRIALFHLNDARNGLGSHRDGHCRIGEGRIPTESWTEFFAALPGIPVVMETPYDSTEVDAEQVRLVKELAGGLPNSSE